MSGGRWAKGLPEFVYFIGKDNEWVQGPYVQPKKATIAESLSWSKYLWMTLKRKKYSVN